ncbi:MAG: hypothetical protein ACTS1Z_04730 [Parasphingopyxis sp.]|uniref:hypothetical protein n=1 Tax=Parasphingopyxis sp. TaxID=1920299 RepID=UPI003F9F3CFA
MPTVTVTSIFNASADRVWDEVRSTRLLQYIVRGRVVFDPIDPPQFPVEWSEGDYKVAMRGFGFVPLGSQIIGIEFPQQDGDTRILQDNGGGPLFRAWDHWIFVEPLDDGRTKYTDRVEFDAGILNGVVKLVVRDFFGHRQRRWKKLIANDFRY